MNRVRLTAPVIKVSWEKFMNQTKPEIPTINLESQTKIHRLEHSTTAQAAQIAMPEQRQNYGTPKLEIHRNLKLWIGVTERS